MRPPRPVPVWLYARYPARMEDTPRTAGETGTPEDWSPASVQALRRHMAVTQTELAERIGTRQQTVSEWETGTARPRRMGRRILSMVAEESGFYSTDGSADEATSSRGDDAAHDAG